MKKHLVFYCYATFLTIFLSACGKKTDDGGTFFPDAPANPNQSKLVDLVNQFRAANETCGSQSFVSVGNIAWNDTLALVAKKHSEDMLANDKLNHVGTNGSFVNDRIAAEGYEYSFYAENLLKGGATEEEAIQAWIQSAAHCENMMAPNVNEMGVGTAGPYWTMVLASH